MTAAIQIGIDNLIIRAYIWRIRLPHAQLLLVQRGILQRATFTDWIVICTVRVVVVTKNTIKLVSKKLKTHGFAGEAPREGECLNADSVRRF